MRPADPPRPTRAIRAVFFDAGNTLFRESPIRWEIYASVAREFGLSGDPERMRAAMVRAHEETPIRVNGHFRYTNGWFQTYLSAVFRSVGAREDQIPPIAETLVAAFRDRRTFVIFPEVEEVIGALRARGLAIGIISNWSPRLPSLLRDLALAPRFDFVLCSAIEEVEKPDPEIFARALARAGTAPEESIHVGDSLEKDVEGALASGIVPAFLDRPGPHGLDGDTASPGRVDEHEETGPQGAFRIRDLRGLLPLLDGRGR
jgi:putative hydrolase of the HAD superfamily